MPPGWIESTISDLVSDDGVFVDGDWVETKDQDPDGEVRLIQLADVGDGAFLDRSSRFLTATKAGVLRCTMLRENDILIARMPQPLGRACIFPGSTRQCVTVVDVCIVSPGSMGPDPRWLMHVANAPQMRSAMTALQSGSTRQRISRANLARIPIPVPPVPEQLRIVAEIEKQFTRLDAATAALQRARSNLKRCRSSATEAAFVSHSTAPIRRLGDLGEIVGGLAKGQKRKVGTRTRPVPYLRVANVQRGHLDLHNIKLIEATEEEIRSLQLMPGDVLLNEGGDRDKLGRGWIWEGQITGCIHQNHVFRVRLDPLLAVPKFVSQYANHFGQKYFFEEGKQTTNLASINMTKLGALPIPLPHVEEQETLVTALEDYLSLLDNLDHSIDTDLRRTTTLRQAILNKAFEGKLVPQDPNDEPASILLGRIRAARARTPVRRAQRKREVHA